MNSEKSPRGLRFLSRLIKGILRNARDLMFYPRFYTIKIRAHGMLPVKTYAAIYDTIYDAPDLDVVEVGGGSGAGSVTIAKALVESGKSANVIVVEKCEGGSRTQFGNRVDNLEYLETVFEKFGVSHRVRLFPEHLTYENGDQVKSMIRSDKISCLILDADGRIDRDIFLFWELLVDEGSIIIDDYIDRKRFRPISERYPRGGTKEITTFRLTNQFTEWGLIEPVTQIGHTLFCKKPKNARFSTFDIAKVTQIIDQIWEEYKVDR